MINLVDFIAPNQTFGSFRKCKNCGHYSPKNHFFNVNLMSKPWARIDIVCQECWLKLTDNNERML